MAEHIVVGHGIVAHRFVSTLGSSHPEADLAVTVIGDEADPAYDRVGLSSYIGAWERAELHLEDARHTTDPRVTVRAAAARAGAGAHGVVIKVTGGQRIDLFGARVDELPAIWRRLVDSGMESGHAYGKSLRTVKSCVGTSWCRYGQQDSVGMAVLLETRYRGLRAPHKIKMGRSPPLPPVRRGVSPRRASDVEAVPPLDHGGHQLRHPERSAQSAHRGLDGVRVRAVARQGRE